MEQYENIDNAYRLAAEAAEARAAGDLLAPSAEDAAAEAAAVWGSLLGHRRAAATARAVYAEAYFGALDAARAEWA